MPGIYLTHSIFETREIQGRFGADHKPMIMITITITPKYVINYNRLPLQS